MTTKRVARVLPPTPDGIERAGGVLTDAAGGTYDGGWRDDVQEGLVVVSEVASEGSSARVLSAPPKRQT